MPQYVFGYDTALSIYRQEGTKILGRQRVMVDVSASSVAASGLKGTGWFEWMHGSLPIHLISGNAASHRSNQLVETHAWSSTKMLWPAIELTEGIYVSSPEFLFLQMANVLNKTELIFLGCELCGEYGFGNGESFRRPQLSDKERLRTFLTEACGANGRAKAQEALAYVIGPAASPREVELGLRLTLPTRMGGRGIKLPEFNSPIELDSTTAKSFGYHVITPDLLWRNEMLAAEYDSDARHVGAERITADSRRRFALKKMGYVVLTITNGQMNSKTEFDEIVAFIARNTHTRIRTPSPGSLYKRSEVERALRRCALHPDSLTWQSSHRD